MNSWILSFAIDADDQAKHHCPKHSFNCRSLTHIKKIIQQFIGVLDHGVGYGVYRRLPYVQKGANLTLTMLLDLISRGHLKGKSQLYMQWDGASENVAKTNLRFFIWLLLYCGDKNLPLDTITVCRCALCVSTVAVRCALLLLCVRVTERVTVRVVMYVQVVSGTHAFRCRSAPFCTSSVHSRQTWTI